MKLNNKDFFGNLIEVKKVDNKMDIKNPAKLFLEGYNKFVKFDSKKKRKVGVFALSLACGTVIVVSLGNKSTVKSSNNNIYETNPFVGTPIAEETMNEWRNLANVIIEEPEEEKEEEIVEEVDEYVRYIPLDLDLGGKYDIMIRKLSSSERDIFYKYADMFGVDPDIVIAMAAQEASLEHGTHIPGGEKYREGGAVGICQIAQIPDWTIHATNVHTGEEIYLDLTLDNISNEELNIMAGCMMLQTALERFNGNPYLAIQSHNYSTGPVGMAVACYAEELGITEEEVMANFNDCGWIKYIQDIHNNPSHYFNWGSGTYGDKDYIFHVLRYYNNETFESHYSFNGELYTFNFLSNELICNNETTRTL